MKGGEELRNKGKGQTYSETKDLAEYFNRYNFLFGSPHNLKVKFYSVANLRNLDRWFAGDWRIKFTFKSETLLVMKFPDKGEDAEYDWKEGMYYYKATTKPQNLTIAAVIPGQNLEFKLYSIDNGATVDGAKDFTTIQYDSTVILVNLATKDKYASWETGLPYKVTVGLVFSK